MKWSWFGRVAMALTSAVALGLSMTACGGGTIAYLWAVGTATAGSGETNGQIVGYKVDDFTGNLTAIPNQPFSANGSNPVTILSRPGGRFVYVIDQGTGYSATSAGTSANIAVYAVGGNGSLTFENSFDSQGFGHVWAQFDTTGNYLFVLDKYSPSGSGNGSITTFTADPTTGRLNLQTQTASTQPNQLPPNYLEVGKNPLRMFATSNCLFTVNSADQSISTYSIAAGQLTTVTTGTFPANTINITSISGNTSYVFLTDNQNDVTKPGLIYPFTAGANCALTPFTGGVKANNGAVANPVNTFVAANNNLVYVLNSSATNTSPTTRGSTLTAYSITNGQLLEIGNSPFATGNGPACMVEDPTAKYLYVADSEDGTITGYDFSNTTGQLGPLQRGSSFKTTATQGLSCLALSGNI